MYAVTGATDRTGAAVARRLLRKGERVRVIGRGGERLKSLAAEGGEPRNFCSGGISSPIRRQVDGCVARGFLRRLSHAAMCALGIDELG